MNTKLLEQIKRAEEHKEQIDYEAEKFLNAGHGDYSVTYIKDPIYEVFPDILEQLDKYREALYKISDTAYLPASRIAREALEII